MQGIPSEGGASGQPGPGAGRRRPILPLLLAIATLSLGSLPAHPRKADAPHRTAVPPPSPSAPRWSGFSG